MGWKTICHLHLRPGEENACSIYLMQDTIKYPQHIEIWELPKTVLQPYQLLAMCKIYYISS